MGLNHAGRGRCESGHAMFCSLRAVCIVLTLGVVASTVVSHVHATDSEDDDLVFEDMDWLSSPLRAIRDVAAGSKNNKRAARQAKPTGKATVNSNLAQFEDYEGSGSEGSGDQELPKYYRCNLTIEQKYEPALSDPASSKSQLLAEALRNDIDNLYSEVDGTQSCNIISFSKTSDPNKVLVELDLGTRGNYDKNALYRTLEKEVQSGQIGAYEVYPEDFGCRDVDGNQFSPVYQLTCNPVEKACKDGSGCYIAEDECNGILDCDDGSDEKNCPTTTTTTTTEAPVITFPTFAPGPDKCRGDTKFTCKDGTRICEVQRCDGEINCPLGDDEDGCPSNAPEFTTTTTTEAQSEFTCEADEFQCDGSNCIPESKWCDGNRDCIDGTDERNCPAPECESDKFQCDTDLCISRSQVCDGNEDCFDGTDELECPEPECGSNQFQCDTNRCISLNQLCDRNADCLDGTDERNCPAPTCQSGEFLCDSDRCIPESSKCDQRADCDDRTDEFDCPPPVPTTCGPNSFTCDDGSCISLSKRCDGRADCPNFLDELNCPNETLCQLDEHKCDSGLCISVSKRCDGNYDCPDRSDERGCPCRQDEWQCDNAKCIDRRLRCDGKADCPNDNSDERECPCDPPKHQCGLLCLEPSAVCDGRRDCVDGSDESNCQTQQCDETEFTCADGLCVSLDLKCDGIPDCNDGSDEEDCPLPCASGEFQCDISECIDNSKRCDGRLDCINGADERDCGGCLLGEHPCDGNSTCLQPSRVCDGIRDCTDGTDEANCKPVCDARREFTCGDGSCVDIRRKCDGYSDCRDRSDEADCPCRGDQFRCGGGQCIDGVRRCDRNYDCPDRSDEQGCPQPPILCPLGQFKCANDEKCILKNLVCDNKYDCSDGSDEANCASPPEGLQLKTYPDEQTIKQGREVVFQCRDEGPIRTPVRWVRGSGLSLPPGSRTTNGRLEMPNIQPEHGGTYVCEAVGYPPSTPGSRVSVYLRVEPFVEPTTRPPSACGLDEATCMNGECVSKAAICNGRFDCSDGSDEMRCGNYSGCEPNEYQCDNRRCILKTWRCDGDDDCGDNSDEKYCEPSPPDSPCRHDEFQCHSQNQCIPKSFHCDMQIDCQDRSDEIGCSSPSIVEPPPPMIMVIEGETWSINCTAVGIPTPEIVWRLNWGHIPPKCTTTSVNGVGVLTCPDARDVDQGAYSCEAINGKVSTFAIPDTILVVKKGESPVCQAGEFNSQAASRAECLNCFCFGITTECSSSRLCITQLPPPRDQYQIIAIPAEATQGRVSVRSRETILAQSYLRSTSSGNGFQVFARDRSQLGASPDQLVYFNLPRSHRGNQLKSYGGYLRYNLEFRGTGRQNSNADVILSGNGMTLLHFGRPVPSANTNNAMTVRFWQGEWYKRVSGRPGGDIPIQAEELASREEIMLALQNIDHLLIKASYLDGPSLDTSVLNVRMDTAIEASSCPQGQAVLVEECRCPQGYTGISCDECAPGYSRVTSGPWLGRCERAPVVCPDGQYGDPGRGIPCQPCPCPSTSSGRSCFLDTDGQVTCNCPACYTGRRCERCDTANGCTGNALDGTGCSRNICNSEGTETSANGVCTCKEFVTGPRCDQCKPNSFYLNNISPSGCVNCFCMGITQQCSSSNWYRQQERAVFTTDNLGFAISDANFRENVTDRLQLNSGARELVYRDFGRQGSDVYYWRLPARFLGDKVSSYGGFLNYTVRYVPAPSGQTSRNNAPDVEIRGNAIRLWYHRQEPVEPNRPVDVSVPFWEQNWQRQDGQLANREHLLMALADLDYILIKATYTTRTAEAALLEVTLDYAEDRNTGQSRALAVEHCACPRGYRGLSCEDCDVGYTRSADGLYLGLCEPCSCNGHSDECDPETGVCLNCRDHTTGDNCERCESGYEGDATQGTSSDCRSRTPGCRCDPRGSQSADCPDGRQCLCKANVEGENCDRCREGTFGLMAQNSQGCLSCYCSGVSQACSSANLYRTQIPMQIVDASHGFRLTDSYRSNVISTGLTVDAAQNVITYSPPGSRSSTTLYWSLPSLFTGNKVTSYGGRLSVTQSYQADGRGQPLTDKDVLLIGNGVTLFFVNPNAIQSSQTVTYTVPLRESGWRRLDGPGSVGASASRNDMMLVLSNLEAILIRATYSSSMSSTSLSNVIMDTAIPQYTGQEQPRDVEQCRCPTGYRGYSCEDCERGYYRDRSDRSNPAGICRRCPCGGNEESCYQAADLRSVTCVCLPGFSGRACSPSESENSEVIVPEKPTITVTVTTSRIQVVDAGSTARFQCSARSLIGRQVSIRWTKEIGELPRGRSTQDPSVGLLVITSVNSGDAGVYVCSAFDGLNTVTETAVLNVKEETSPRAPQVTVEPRFVDVSLGQTVDVRCVAEGNPQPTINWLTPQGNPVESQFVSGSQLRILSARKNDEGEYICSASNSVGTNTARVAVFVRSTPAPTPGETVTVTITPQESVLRKGEALRLSCQADGRAAGYSSRDPVTIRWTRVEGPLPSNAIQSGTSLVINSVSASDSGIYVCTAAYASGGSFQSQARVTVLAHRGPPTIRIEPDRQTISQGTNAELRCLATGDPNPTIRWTRFGENFGSNVYVSGPVLRITNALVEDRGMYICTAENPGGTAQASAIIEVERREPPAVELYPQARQTVVRGASALFQCRYTAGIPTPVVTWARTDGRPMSPNIEILDSGVIRFNRVTGSERGQYLCTASNDVGITTATAFLEIQSAPEVKLSPSGSIRVKMGSRQRLECRAEGEPAPTVSWKRLRTGFLYDALASPVSETPQVAVYEITRVTRADEGTYSCTARNAAGDTEERVQLIVEEDDSDNEISNGGNNQGPTGTVTSDIFTVPLGGTAEMRCYVYGSSQDLYLEWNRSDGGKMPLNKRIKDGVIYIDDVQREAAGDYECVGVNSVSGQIVFRVSTRLEVVVPPRITLNPARQTVRPGDYVLITCSATGDQPITIEWSKLGQALPPSVVVNSGQLQFRSIAVSDAGRYSCVAKNSVGQAEAVAEVIVNDTPVTSGNQREVTVEAGATAELRCYAPTSSVSPRVHWSRDRGQLQNNALPQANVLRLVNVQVSDSGRYICVVAAADGTRTSDYVLLRVQRTSQVSLKIRSNADEIHLGESVELVCEVSGASNAFVTWKKLASASMPRGVQVLDNVLRIPSVGSEHGGVYQCEVRVGSSTYEQEYAISIQTVTESASSSVETRTASFGTTVVMDCRTDLRGQVTFRWSKQGGVIRRDAVIRGNTLNLTDVRAEDAGTYVCTAQSSAGKVDIPVMLVVTGVVPYFAQAPVSFMSLPTLPDAYFQFEIEVSFKPESSDGLVLYNGQQSDGRGDFVSFGLNNGYPEFRFDVGAGPAVIRGDKPLELGKWHTVKLSRNRKDGTMTVDDEGPFYGSVAANQFQGLDLSEPMYIGGVPNIRNIHRLAGFNRGFVGCISRLVVGSVSHELMKDAQTSKGVTSCETCAVNPCENGGVCQEAHTEQGYACLCPAGFSGDRCQKVGDACYPGACEMGRCVNSAQGFECYCPFGKTGSRCEQDIDIQEPAFRDGSYVAYPTPKALNKLKMSMRFKPKETKDGILAYCAQKEDGAGDFASLAIKDRKVEFRFDTGSGPAILRSTREIQAGEWVSVAVDRNMQTGSLVLNQEPAVRGRSPGRTQGLNLNTKLYVGGWDKQRIRISPSVNVTAPFDGCVSYMEVAGMNFDLIDSIVDAANVDECAVERPCQRKPCLNGGLCEETGKGSMDYQCQCQHGFSGKSCELEADLCQVLQPCANGGTCVVIPNSYKCNCPLGFGGDDCEKKVDIGEEAYFEGDGYIEVDKSLMPHIGVVPETITIEFSTTEPNGVLLWHGQKPETNGKDKDYLALAVVNGHLVLHYDLGSGPAHISTSLRVDDGQRHKIVATRNGRDGSVQLDGIFIEHGSSGGNLFTLNTKGNIYIGGLPNAEVMTGGRYMQGFAGCIHSLKLQNSGVLNFQRAAILAINVSSCTSGSGMTQQRQEVVN